jgi:hypothetical protein
LNTQTSVNASVGGNSTSADTNSSTSADAQHHGKSGSAQANSSTDAQAKASHSQKSRGKDDKK